MAEDEEASPTVRVGGESPGAIKLCFQGLTRSFPEEQGDQRRDFLVTAESEAVQVKVTVRTWGSDGLDALFAELAEEHDDARRGNH